jgi:hypothetical protein
MKNQKLNLGLVLILTVIFTPFMMGAFTMIDFAAQISGKPTTLSGYGITDGASSTDLSNHMVDQSTHGCSEIASTTLVTTHTGAAIGVHGLAAGVAVVGASSSQTLTNKSISGEQIDSGTVADARVASTLARDTEVTSAVGDHNALNANVQGCTAIASTTALACAAPAVVCVCCAS